MKDHYSVIIVGAGPAGMFCADRLANRGETDILILEGGKSMEKRKCPETKECNCRVCDILEGEGGAGGFSDGKKTYSLGRGTQMEEIFNPKWEEELQYIDEVITRWGGEGLAFEPVAEEPKRFKNTKLEFGSYPLRHIGSDGVRDLIIGHMKWLRDSGVDALTRATVDSLIYEKGEVKGVVVRDNVNAEMRYISADNVVVASGLQGSPWLERELKLMGIELGSGPAGFGIRVECPADVLRPVFDDFYDFKLILERGDLSYRSFCCNQEGWIVNENHYPMGVRNVNGHSYLEPSLRSDSSNFAVICKVPQGYVENPQEVVRSMARAVNSLSGGHPGVQRTIDYVRGESSEFDPEVKDSSRTNFQSRGSVNIRDGLITDIADGFSEFLTEMNKALSGVVSSESVLYAPEIKYYGKKVPVDFDSWKVDGVEGLYVVGNASGYLDSFVSAGLSGIISAEHILEKENE